MIKKRNILIIVIVLLSLILLKVEVVPAEFYQEYKEYVPVYSAPENYPLPFLFLSDATPALAMAKADYFRSFNVGGFVFSTLPSNWYNHEEELKEYFSDCQGANRKFANNFLKINIAEGDLPNWGDSASWQQVYVNLGAVAKFARETGFKGLVLDTTAYNKAIWNPAYYSRYNNISEELAKKIIYQRGRELAQVLYHEFPRADIAFAAIGFLSKKREKFIYDKYYYWSDFVNGFLSVDAENSSCYFFTEKSYSLLADQDFAALNAQVAADMQEAFDAPLLWPKKGGLIQALFPLGRSEYDKGSLVKPEVFKQQLLLSQKHSTGYVIICSQGQAWWQFSDGEEYGLDQKQSQLPTIANLAEYQNSLTLFEDPYLSAYFYQKKMGQHQKLWQFYLKRILDILHK